MRFEFPCPASGVPLHLANSWFWHLLFLRQAGPDWIAFPKTTSKIGCFVYSACWEFPAWRLNSALPGVKQRRQDVRENFLHAALRNSQFLKWFSGQAIPPSPAVPSAAKPSARVRLQPCAGRGAPERMRRNARGPGGNCGRIDSAHLTCRNS